MKDIVNNNSFHHQNGKTQNKKVGQSEGFDKKTVVQAPEGNERYRILIENTHDIVYSLDLEGNLTYISPQARRYGFKPGELISQNFLDFVHPKDREEMLYGFQKTITEGSEFISQFRIKNKRGRVYWVEEYGKVQHDQSGAVVGINGVLRDVTERKRIEEKLRKAHEGLERKVQERTAELRKTNEALHVEIKERKSAERALQESYSELHRALEGTIHALASTVEKRDPYTAGHQKRVSNLACAIAREMSLEEEMIKGIRMVGFIHDLGKIYVPAEILNKPGHLTDVESTLIRTHAMVGYDILKSVEFPWPIAQVIIQHHERIDGSGYPLGLSGEEILLEAKIIGVADAIEAIASHRPYRPALGLEKALEEVSEKKGILYDPDVVDACLRLFNDKGYYLA
jgi:PAS domain S-box-containing protein/putative nucleotidyltransferase with HDIG domain